MELVHFDQGEGHYSFVLLWCFHIAATRSVAQLKYACVHEDTEIDPILIWKSTVQIYLLSPQGEYISSQS